MLMQPLNPCLPPPPSMQPGWCAVNVAKQAHLLGCAALLLVTRPCWALANMEAMLSDVLAN